MMAHDGVEVYAGVDTHKATCHAAVIDGVGRELGDREFPSTIAGYEALGVWIASFGVVVAVGVEGTGSYGAGLARYLARIEVAVVEVDRPDRAARRRSGKSDPLDAYAAATAAKVSGGGRQRRPKARDGAIEALRALRVVRTSAVRARTQNINQIKALIVTAPAVLREKLEGLGAAALIPALAKLRPGPDLAEPTAATKKALRMLAGRCQQLTEEIRELDAVIRPLLEQAAPQLMAIYGVGTESAAKLLQAAGDNPERLRSPEAFAHLCGTAPIPASSGQIRRHRLNRAGDRQANSALYTIVITRLSHDARTRAYAERRTAQGLSKKEIIRCLKRYVVREVYRAIIAN
jgi:transposase